MIVEANELVIQDSLSRAFRVLIFSPAYFGVTLFTLLWLWEQARG